MSLERLIVKKTSGVHFKELNKILKMLNATALHQGKDNNLFANELKKLQLMAKDGYPPAQFELAQLNEDTGLLGEHPEIAAKWYLKAAKAKHSEAANMIAFYYQKGLGVKVNRKKALLWYLNSAKYGSIIGTYNLARTYEIGDLTNINFKKAFFHYQRASRKGFADAQLGLSRLYLNGSGVKRNLKKAILLCKKALKSDPSEEGRTQLKRCEAELKKNLS